MSRHMQTLADARDEAKLMIPLNREVFYDFTKMEIDDECGQLYPNSIIEDLKGNNQHNIDNVSKWLGVMMKAGVPATVVEAETCESGKLHFVRIHHVAGYGPFAREYIWDQNH